MGVAPLLPIIRALKAAGNRVVSVLCGRTKELIILEKEVRESSDDVIIMTDDGSYGKKGISTAGVEEVIQREKVDYCVTIGPAIMMKFVSLLTKKYEIPTEASLNAIMVDGTGMCGACRVTVGGRTRFVCVEGPEFNAHEIDFDELLMRLRGYSQTQKQKKWKITITYHAMKNGAWNCAAAFRQKSALLSSVWKCLNSTLHTASPAMRR